MIGRARHVCTQKRLAISFFGGHLGRTRQPKPTLPRPLTRIPNLTWSKAGPQTVRERDVLAKSTELTNSHRAVDPKTAGLARWDNLKGPTFLIYTLRSVRTDAIVGACATIFHASSSH